MGPLYNGLPGWGAGNPGGVTDSPLLAEAFKLLGSVGRPIISFHLFWHAQHGEGLDKMFCYVLGFFAGMGRGEHGSREDVDGHMDIFQSAKLCDVSYIHLPHLPAVNASRIDPTAKGW